MSKIDSVSKRDILAWRYGQIKARIKKVGREVRHWVDRPGISILGAYHGENVGDISLGNAVQEVLRQSGHKGALQDLYDLQRQSIGDNIILGGGATGVEENIRRLATVFGSAASRTAMVGMDFSGDFADYSDKALSYLRNVAHISCRSKKQKEMVAHALQRDDIKFNYDNAFALTRKDEHSTLSGGRVLGYNALNLFMMWTGDRFEPGTYLGDWYRKVDSPIVPYIEHIGPAYILVLQKALSAYKKMGYRILHIPFTPEDSFFAKTYLRPQTDTFLPYTSNVRHVTGHVMGCDRLLATRYHSLVFGIKLQIPTIPILYAAKLADLLKDLGIAKECGIERTDLVDETDSCVDQLVNGTPILLDVDRIETIKKEVRRGIDEAFQSITKR